MSTVDSRNNFDGVSNPKKAKLDNKLVSLESNVHDNIANLSDFKLEEILQNNTNRKTVCLKGTFKGREGSAVLILEKTAFTKEHLANDSDYFTNKSTLEKVFQNDIYGDYKYFTVPELNSIKTTIIHPASEKHIVKFSAQTCHIVEETQKIYEEIVLPTLTNEKSHLQWVYNILEHKSEVDRIIFEDVDPTNGFLMVPDLKWSGDLDTLYMLAIVNKRNIKSLRDLTKDHLPLLKNIKEKGTEAIKEKYGLGASQLRVYFHYRPSFYHLHVHFCALRHEAPGILAEKAHLLSNVISNIELLGDYYQKVTLPFVVRENESLFKNLVAGDILNQP